MKLEEIKKLREDVAKIVFVRRKFQGAGVDIRCMTHPTYRGLRDPRVKCIACMIIRLSTQEMS